MLPTGLTQPRSDEDGIDALDGLTDSGHHRVDLLGQVVVCVDAQALLLLELLQGVGSLTRTQIGAVLQAQNHSTITEGTLLHRTATRHLYSPGSVRKPLDFKCYYLYLISRRGNHSNLHVQCMLELICIY